MKKNLLDLSEKINKSTTELFEIISRIADPLEIPFFVVGATARDMILHYGYGLEAKRGTVDIDFGVQVSSWDQYKNLEKGLLETGLFKSAKEAQRLFFKDGTPVDIVPFGSIGDERGEIAWPPDHSVKMSIIGFQEAYDHDQRVRIKKEPELIISLATPIGLTIMKLISWEDGLPERKQKDAYDVAFILQRYSEILNFNEISKKHSDLIEADDFDFIYAGARVLGRDIAKILKTRTKAKVIEILDKQTGEQDRYALVEDMIKAPSVFRDPFKEFLKLLEKLKKGIQEGTIS